jgi:predicted house-cleaning noncanonical NTP pyrophosphatase (MazG superfamily)
MRKFRFAKLVRDNIVEAIVSKGNTPKWRTLSDEEYIVELKKKLVEESAELVGARNEEVVTELADIQEILDNLLEALNVSKNELVAAQNQKNVKNGSFKKRQYIDIVEVGAGASEIEYYLKYPEKYPEVSE